MSSEEYQTESRLLRGNRSVERTALARAMAGAADNTSRLMWEAHLRRQREVEAQASQQAHESPAT